VKGIEVLYFFRKIIPTNKFSLFYIKPKLSGSIQQVLIFTKMNNFNFALSSKVIVLATLIVNPDLTTNKMFDFHQFLDY